MDAELPFWIDRRVCVVGVTGPLGTALVERFDELGADLCGVVAERPDENSDFLKQRIYERVRPIRAKSMSARTLAAAFAAHEIELIVDVHSASVRVTHAMLNAARLAVPSAAVMIVTPHMGVKFDRLMAMVRAFRAERKNPIAVTASADIQTILDHSKRCILRDVDVIGEKVRLRAA